MSIREAERAVIAAAREVIAAEPRDRAEKCKALEEAVAELERSASPQDPSQHVGHLFAMTTEGERVMYIRCVSCDVQLDHTRIGSIKDLGS